MTKDSILFHALTALSLAVFGLGIYAHLTFWLRGSLRGPAGLSSSGKLGVLLRQAGGSLARPAVLWDLFWNLLLQRRLWRLSFSRWLMHMALFWGCVELFFIGSLGNMAADLGLIGVTKDTPWFAAASDTGGALLLIGIALALYRRFIARAPELRTTAPDIWLIVLLTAALFSGFALEAIRLLASGIPAASAGYSFLGYPLALALQGLGLDWPVAEIYLWWFHALSGLTSGAYLPYSKLFHLLVAPVAVGANARRREPEDLSLRATS